MKQKLAALIFTVSLTFIAYSADSPVGTITFKNCPLDKVLSMYQELSGGKIIQSSQVKRLKAEITVRSASPLSKADAMKLIEKALIAQAGIVITPLGDNSISVTFNDALPIQR